MTRGQGQMGFKKDSKLNDMLCILIHEFSTFTNNSRVWLICWHKKHIISGKATTLPRKLYDQRQWVELLGTEEVQCWIHHVTLLLHFLRVPLSPLRCIEEKKSLHKPLNMTGRSEDEFEKVIAAYLRVRCGTHWVLCVVFIHALCPSLYLTPPTDR